MQSVSEKRIENARLNLIKNKSKMKKGKYRAEMAKLNLIKNDPTFALGSELNLISRGAISTALFSYIDRNFILPAIAKFMDKKR